MAAPRKKDNNGKSEVAALEVNGVSVRLYQRPFTIGRSDSCSLTVGDSKLSRTHCRIDREGDEYKLVVLGYSPVKLNGITAGQFVYLRNGDVLELGEMRCTFRAPKKRKPSSRGVRPISRREAEAEAAEERRQAEAKKRHRASTSRHLPDREVDIDHFSPMLIGGLAALVAMLLGGLVFVTSDYSEPASASTAPRIARAPQVSLPPAETRPVDDSDAAVVGSSGGKVVDDGQPDEVAAPTRAAQPQVKAAQRKAERERSSEDETPRRAKPTKRRALPGEATEGDDVGEDPFAEELPVGDDKKQKKPTATGPDAAGAAPSSGASAGEQSGTVSRMKKPEPKDYGGSREVPIRFIDEDLYGKRIAFVLDHSGSMAPLWGMVQQELVTTLRALTPEHEFALILYNNQTQIFSRRWQPGSKDRIEKAIEWVNNTPAKGATDPEPALRKALRMKGIEALVFLSDCKFRKRTERIYQLLKLATKGTKKFKAIKLWYLPVSDGPGVAKIMSLSSGKPGGSLEMRLRGARQR